MKFRLILPCLALIVAGLVPRPGGAEDLNTIELPGTAHSVPLPEGWTRQQFIDRFILLWATTPKGLFENRWMGVLTYQNPMDVWVTQEILYEVQPEIVVECGSFKGGSSVLWSMVIQESNPDARVITIDITDQRPPHAIKAMEKRKVEFLLGSSTDPEIVAKVKKRTQGKRAVFILDSDHSAPHVLRELRAYAPMVEVGSYVIVQDGVINGHPLPSKTGPGPWEAVHEFMDGNTEFAIDRTRERMLVTSNPDGFLKRIAPPKSAAK